MCVMVCRVFSVHHKIKENNKLYIFLTHPAHISVILSVYTPEARKGFRQLYGAQATGMWFYVGYADSTTRCFIKPYALCYNWAVYVSISERQPSCAELIEDLLLKEFQFPRISLLIKYTMLNVNFFLLIYERKIFSFVEEKIRAVTHFQQTFSAVKNTVFTITSCKK